MKREVFADTEVMKVVNTQVVPIMINVDDPKNKELGMHYKSGGTPITIFKDPQGEVLDYAYGKIGKTKFITTIPKNSPLYSLKRIA